MGKGWSIFGGGDGSLKKVTQMSIKIFKIRNFLFAF